MRTEGASLRQTLTDEVESGLNDLEQERDRLQAEITGLRDAAEVSASRLVSAETERDEAQRRGVQAQAESEGLRARQATLEQERDRLLATSARWQLRAESTEAEHRRLIGTIEAVRTEGAPLRQALTDEVESKTEQLRVLLAEAAAVRRERDEFMRLTVGYSTSPVARLHRGWRRLAVRHPTLIRPLSRTIRGLSLVLTLQVPRGRDAPALFDRDWYLEQNPDVRVAGGDPYDHYRKHNVEQGRNPNPYFDVKWYIEHNPDVTATGMDPLDHYSRYGWLEGRDPGPLFDTYWYLWSNPDVAASGQNPLLHYLRWGRQEGRLPRADVAAGRHDTH